MFENLKAWLEKEVLPWVYLALLIVATIGLVALSWYLERIRFWY